MIHLAGEPDSANGVQRCSLCGVVLANDEDTPHDDMTWWWVVGYPVEVTEEGPLRCFALRGADIAPTCRSLS